MKSAAEANVDTAKDAATLQMHREMNGNADGMHPAVVVGKLLAQDQLGSRFW